MTEFKINDYLTVKLRGGKAVIYVDGKRFRQCKFLLLIIPQENEEQHEINSIDEADELFSSKLEKEITPKDLGLRPEQEFFGHCSNLQVWAEMEYDTRLLHRYLAFPLLKKLTEAGDPIAKKVFKEEIAQRFLSGYLPVAIYLMIEGYFDYLDDEEFNILIEEFRSLLKKPNSNFKNVDVANAWNNLSLVFCKREKYNKAIKASKQALEIKPDFIEAWNNLGHIYNEKGEYDKAIKHLNRALEFNPNYFLPWNNLALAYIQKSEYDKAIEASKRALEIEPEFANSMCHLGFAYYKLGDLDKAIELIKKALDIKSNYERGWRYLSTIYNAIGDYDNAIIIYRKLAKLRPDI